MFQCEPVAVIRESGFPAEFERRSEARRRCRQPFEVQVEHEGRRLPARIEAFSRRGLLLRTPVEAAPGCTLAVHAPDLGVTVRGHVRSRIAMPRSLDAVQWGALGIEISTLPHDLAACLEARLG